jgi:hydrogenase-4 component B
MYLTSTLTITCAMALCVLGAAVSLLFSWNKTLAGWIAFLFTAASSFLALLSATIARLRGPEVAVTLWSLPQFGSSLRLYVDGLSSIFILLIATIAVASAFYSIRYMKQYPDYSVARYYPNFLLFIAGMYGIVTTTDLMVFFCFFWQLMTLPSYVLIRYEFRKRANVQASNMYLLMMEIACALVMLAAYLLAGPGPVQLDGETLMKYDFDALRETVGGLLPTQGGMVTLALVLFLIGFGIKAGMWPFGQTWLPDAHPAAPSPVSSLLSGVMIKTGVYGLMRSFLWLIPAASIADYPAQTWGMILSVLGTVTLFLGTMQALKQEQSKRLLAFHSIGQVGYILLGLGACVALLPAGLTNASVLALAAIGLYGALFHTFNHGIFKSLLFLDAGSMLYATDTQDLNRMGGLMKYMPITAVTTLIASFSIAGVPLFNGFASKWSIYVATILGSREAGYLAICGVIGIVTSALTLASFIKFFGAAFLSRTSATVANKAAGRKLEVGWTMQLPQIALAGLCLLLGLFPSVAYQMIRQTLFRSPEGFGSILGRAFPAVANQWQGLVAAGKTALFAPLVVALMLLVMFVVAWTISKLGSAERRSADIWLCGYAKEADMHRYGAHHLYGEVKKYFKWVGGMPKKQDESSH